MMDNIKNENVYLEETKENVKDDDDNSVHSPAATCSENVIKWPTWSKSTNADDDDEALYTDWTIDVTFVEDANNCGSDDRGIIGETISYYVHRYVLGPQSEYFHSLFRNTSVGFSEMREKRSTIKLPTPVISSTEFEMLLNCLYGFQELIHTSKSAVAMVYFGDYFGINLVKVEAQKFIRKSITESMTKCSRKSLQVLAKYHQDAVALSLEDLQNAVAYACAGQPQSMLKENALMKIPDEQFWYRVCAARKYHPQTDLSNKLWSINVSNLIEFNSDIIIDREFFLDLTHLDSMPVISFNAAIILMKKEHQLFKSSKVKDAAEDELTCLQKRCMDSLVDSETGDWKIANPDKFLKGKLRNLNYNVLESLLLRTSLHDKNNSRKYCPDYIEVVGAGTDCVNGIYDKTGYHEGYPTFTKTGTYNGNAEVFHLFKFHGRFYISIIPEGCKIGMKSDIDFYNTLPLKENSDPSNERWKRGSGISPSPTILFIDV